MHVFPPHDLLFWHSSHSACHLSNTDLREECVCSCCWWWVCVFPECCSQAVGSCTQYRIMYSFLHSLIHTQTHTPPPYLAEVPGTNRPVSTLTHQQNPVLLWHWTALYLPSALHSGTKRSSEPWMAASASADIRSCSQVFKESGG